jgi:diguanylate cyclase (GGDEF)-like protein
MANSADDLQQLLQALSAQFRERLRKELPELAQQAAELVNCTTPDSAEPLLQAVRDKLHKLAGAAGTFGYAQLGEQARVLELASVALLQQSSSAQLQAHAVALQHFSQFDCAQPTSHHHPDDSAPTSPRVQANELNRRIYILESDLPLGLSLQSTLRNFGYAADHFTSGQALQAAINQQLPDVLIIDTDLDADNPDGLLFAEKLQQQLPFPLPLLALSCQTDFATRLRAVRAGVAGYFNKPINFSALESRLDNIFAQQRGEPYRVLVIDDDVELSSRYSLVLDNAGMQVQTLNQPQNIDSVMHSFNPEVIMLDVHMPQCSGPELAQIIRFNDAWLRVPIIYLSAETDIGKQMGALLKAGDDFVTKPISDNALVATVLARAQRARLLSNALARDSLTGLLKHADIKEQVALEVERANRSDKPTCVVMLDLDHFKEVNDRYGHAVGDNVIRALANLLRQRLRRVDSLGRYGGEEFTAVLPECNLQQATEILDAIRLRFAELQFSTNDSSTFSVTFSAGIAQSQSQFKASELIELADQALYVAKAAGRNRVQGNLTG